MIQVVQGFRLSTRDAVDNRLLLTKAEMRSINDNQMPDKYFAICKDDGKLYLYDKSKVVDTLGRSTDEEDTGKFTLFSAATITSIVVNGEELPCNDGIIDLPITSDENFGLVKIGKGLASTGGVITIDFNSLDDEIIPASKIDFSGMVIDADIDLSNI